MPIRKRPKPRTRRAQARRAMLVLAERADTGGMPAAPAIEAVPLVPAVPELDLDSSEVDDCAVCLATPVEVTLQPCGHMFCRECPRRTQVSGRSSRDNKGYLKCPICRQQVTGITPSELDNLDAPSSRVLQVPLVDVMRRNLHPLAYLGVMLDRRPRVNEDGQPLPPIRHQPFPHS